MEFVTTITLTSAKLVSLHTGIIHLITVLCTSINETKSLTLGDTLGGGEGARVVRGSCQQSRDVGFHYTSLVGPASWESELTFLG
jgi:hypothetical protein